MKKVVLIFILQCLIIFCSNTIFAVEDIGIIVVEQEDTDKINEFYEESIYNESETEYIDTDTYLPKAPSQKRISSKQALGIAGVQGDPIKAIQIFSGVTGGDDTSGELFIHGSKPRENSVSINHLPVGFLYHLGGIYSVIAPESIDQIDTYLGGFDVTYGNAMGGVIDITPKYPYGERESYLHLGLYDSSAGTSFKVLENINGFIGGRRSYFDLFAPKTGDLTDEIEYTRFPRFQDASFILTGNKDNHMFSFEMIVAKDGMTIFSEEDKVKDPEASGTIGLDMSFSTIGIRWRFDDGGNYSSNTLLYDFQTKEKTDLFDNYYVKADFHEKGLYHLSKYKYNKHDLNFGFEYRLLDLPLDHYVPKPPRPDDYDYDFTSSKKYRYDSTLSILTYGLFIQDIYQITEEKLYLRYGVRIDYSTFESYETSIDPRSAIVYNIDDKSSLSFSFGRYSQFPEGEKNIKDLGNPELVYERAYHYTLSYSHKLKNGANFMVEPYYKKFVDLAVEDKVKKYVNKGNGYSYGFDLTYNQKFRKDINLIVAYTYLESKRELTNGGEMYDFYGEIPHTLQVVGSYDIGNNWVFSTKMKYHTGKNYTPIKGNYQDTDNRVRPIYGEPFSEKLADYFSLDIKIAKRFLFKNTSLESSIEIMNVTNHKNIAGIKYDNNYNKDGYEKQLPLMPWFDLIYRF